MEHTWYKCPDSCDGCQFCLGGLGCCTVCGGIEGQLLAKCPGYQLTPDEHEANYAKNLDKWYHDSDEYTRPTDGGPA